MEGLKMEPFKGREIDYDKPVEVYRCLNRKGKIFSIRQNGLVVAHTGAFILKDCELIVNKAGKKRSMETGERNVHAFIKGYLTDIYDIKLTMSWLLRYDPFSELGFHIIFDGWLTEELKKARIVYFTNKKRRLCTNMI